MDRRNFLKTSTLVASSSVLTAPTVLRASTKKHRWRLALVVPKTLPIWGTGVVSFAKEVKEMTSGRLDIRVYGAGELVPALQVFEAVKSGAIQMGHGAAYYWQGKMPASVFFTAVPFGMNSQGMKSWLEFEGQDLWDELYKPHDVFALPAGNTGLQMGGWFNKRIESPTDFKGLKMRIPGLGGKVLERLGGKPTLVAGSEIYTNLATGVIDATEWVGPYHDYVMGFHKAAKYYYYPGWHEPGPVLELLINKKAWDKLPTEYQQIVRSASKSLDWRIHNQWLDRDSEYFEIIRSKTAVEINPFPKEVISKLRDVSLKVRQEVASTSPLAKKISDSFLKFKSRYDSYQQVSERAFTNLLEQT